jgi:hypothetical protein
MIVTADEALVPNAELAESAAFAEALAARLRSADGASSSASGAHGALHTASGSSSSSGAGAPLLPRRPRSAGDLTRLSETSAAGGGAAVPPSAAAAAANAALLRRVPLSAGVLFSSAATPPSSSASLAASAASALLHPRPPANVVKTWLLLDREGRTRTLLLDKHAVAARYAVPLRDLRVLDIGLTTSCVVLRACVCGGCVACACVRRAHSNITRPPDVMCDVLLCAQVFDGAAVPQAHHRDQPGAREGARMHPRNKDKRYALSAPVCVCADVHLCMLCAHRACRGRCC